MKRKKPFEFYYEDISKEIDKLKSKWSLHAVPSLEFLDFKQLVLIHIFSKWKLVKQDRNIMPYIRQIIRNQWANFLRNVLGRYQSPCIRCPMYNNGHCNYTISKIPDNSCIFFDKWNRSHQKSQSEINLPLSLENHELEVFSIPDDSPINYNDSKKRLDKELKKHLSLFHFRVYRYLFILHKEEKEVNKIFGFKPDKNRADSSSKQIRDAVFVIKQKTKELLENDTIDII